MPRKKKPEKYRSQRQLVEIKRTVGGKRQSFYGKTMAAAEAAYEEAKQKLIEQQTLLSHGITPESDITFKAWAEKWLSVYKKGSVRDVTYYKTYEEPTNRYIISYFGNTLLKDIKPSQIKAFMSMYADKSFSTQHKILLSLRGIFRTALDDGLINNNPVRNIKLSKTISDRETIKRAYTYEEARTVIEFAKTHRYGLDIICLLKSGMRRAELLCMPFRYASPILGGVDLENGLFRVRRSISESSNGIDMEPCKSKKSIRDIPFDDEMHEILLAQPEYIYFKKSDKEYQRKYLISGKYGGYIMPSNWQSDRFAKFKKDFESYAQKENLNIPMLNPHELRHSFGSILYSRGVDIVTISKLMGHESIEITVKLYVHDDLELMKNAILSGV